MPLVCVSRICMRVANAMATLISLRYFYFSPCTFSFSIRSPGPLYSLSAHTRPPRRTEWLHCSPATRRSHKAHIYTIFTILPRFVLHGCAERTFFALMLLHHLRFSSASASTATSANALTAHLRGGIISLQCISLCAPVSFQPRLRVLFHFRHLRNGTTNTDYVREYVWRSHF